MSIGIGAIGGGCSGATQGAGFGAMRGGKLDVSKLTEQAFSTIDTSGQGYIDKAEFESALSKSSGSASNGGTSTADALMKALDGDSDGKITKDEMSSALQKLSDQLETQFNAMRTRQAQGSDTGAMPPPPPGGMGRVMGPPPDVDGAGLTQDQLTTMANDVSQTDSNASADLNKLVASFDAADTDGDGKVSFKEAQTFRQSQQSADASTADRPQHMHHREGGVMAQILRLAASYGTTDSSQQTTTVSATA